MKFKADEIFVGYDEHDVLIIGFSNNSTKNNATIYFLIQDALEYDAQDKKLGMDTYYLEKNDQSLSSYGGIEKIHLSRNRIRFTLNEEGQKKLQEEGIDIEFECKEDEFVNLHNRLDQVFAEGNLMITTRISNDTIYENGDTRT